MRGKVFSEAVSAKVVRITPAYAGKRQAIYHRCGATKDHPRLCGEKFRPLSTSRLHLGSPPPMRGKVGHHRKCIQRPGITPAYAGKSFVFLKSRPPTRDHPRLCGEKQWHTVSSPRCTGSPPPMRGKGSGVMFLSVKVRITPAYAGKR